MNIAMMQSAYCDMTECVVCFNDKSKDILLQEAYRGGRLSFRGRRQTICVCYVSLLFS